MTDTSRGHTVLLCLAIAVCGATFFVGWSDLKAPRKFLEAAEGIDAEETAEELAQEGDMARRLAYGALALLGLSYLVLPRGYRLGFEGLLPWAVLLFLLWCVASLAWSISPGLTARRLAMAAFCVAGALGVAKQLTPRGLCLLTVGVAGAYLAVGVPNEVVAGTLRPLAPQYQFCGTMHPNQQGTSCAMMALAALCLAGGQSPGRGRYWLAFAVAVGFLALTRSRTSNGAFLATLLVLSAVRLHPRTLAAVGLAGAWVACTVLLVVSLVDFSAGGGVLDVLLMGRKEHASSLSGRTPLWAKLLGDYFPQRPLAGYGFGAFWTPKHLYVFAATLDWDIPDAHSIYIETTIGVGLVGLALFVAGVLLAIGGAGSRYFTTGDPGHRFALAVLVYGLFEGLAESGFVMATFYTFVAGCALLQLAFFPESASAGGEDGGGKDEPRQGEAAAPFVLQPPALSRRLS